MLVQHCIVGTLNQDYKGTALGVAELCYLIVSHEDRSVAVLRNQSCGTMAQQELHRTCIHITVAIHNTQNAGK